MTIQEFGQTIKQKHPEYNDMSDEDVGTKVLAKYPQYQDMVQQQSQPTEMNTLQRGAAAIAQVPGEITNAFQKRAENVVTGATNLQQQTESAVAGLPGWLQGIVRTAGGAAQVGNFVSQAVGAAGDIFGTGIKAGAKTLLQQRQQEAVKGAIQGVVQQPIVQGAMQKYGEFKQANPEIAQAAEGLVNVATLGTGSTAAKAAEPIAGEIAQGVKQTAKEAAEITTKGIKLPGVIVNKTVTNSINNDVDNLLKATKSISGKVQEAIRTKTDLKQILSDPQVFKGLKVVSNKINPDEAIATVDDRINKLMEAKINSLPEIDRLVPATNKSVIRQEAINGITGKYTPADEQSLIKRIDNQLNAYPDEMIPSQIDKMRAQMRLSARDAKGQMKSDSEYAALENASRDTLFNITDKLPVENAGEYKALNDYIKQMITTKEFLDKTLRNQVVKGGRLAGYSMKIIGAVAGASHGILGSLAGGEIGGAISSIITNNALGSSLKMKLIRGLTDDPAILTKAEKLTGQLKQATPKMLPAPTTQFRTQVPSGQPIPVIPAGSNMEFTGAGPVANTPAGYPSKPVINAPFKQIKKAKK